MKKIIFLCICLFLLSACAAVRQTPKLNVARPEAGPPPQTTAGNDASVSGQDNKVLTADIKIDKSRVGANEDFTVSASINASADIWTYIRLFVDCPGAVFEVSGVYRLTSAAKTITKTWNAASLPAGEQKVRLDVYDAETAARAFGKSLEKLPEVPSGDIAAGSEPLVSETAVISVEKDLVAGSCGNNGDCAAACVHCSGGSQICIGGEQQCADCLFDNDCKDGYRCADRRCVEDISSRNLSAEDTAACPVMSSGSGPGLADLADPASRERTLAQKDAGRSFEKAILAGALPYRAACGIEAGVSHFFRFSHGKKEKITVSYSGSPAVFRYMGPDFRREEYIPAGNGGGITTLNAVMFNEGYFYLEVENRAGGGVKNYSLEVSSSPYSQS